MVITGTLDLSWNCFKIIKMQQCEGEMWRENVLHTDCLHVAKVFGECIMCAWVKHNKGNTQYLLLALSPHLSQLGPPRPKTWQTKTHTHTPPLDSVLQRKVHNVNDIAAEQMSYSRPWISSLSSGTRNSNANFPLAEIKCTIFKDFINI